MFDYADYIARFEKLQGRHGFQEHFITNDQDRSAAVDRGRAMGRRYVARATTIVAGTCARAAQSTLGQAMLASIVSVAFISAWLVIMAAHGTFGNHRG